MESFFFHSLKAERIYGETFGSDRQLRRALAGYITQLYNRIQLHSGR